MPAGLLKRVNWDLIYPPFMERCFDLAAACRELGTDYYALSGYRSFEEQGQLYMQGRTLPGKIVTKAMPGQSAHNYGIAVDWCKDADLKREGLQPDWDLPDYELLATEAQRLGLEAAYFWKSFREGPHVQLPLAKKGLSLKALKEAHEKGGHEAVFALLDKHGPWF